MGDIRLNLLRLYYWDGHNLLWEAFYGTVQPESLWRITLQNRRKTRRNIFHFLEDRKTETISMLLTTQNSLGLEELITM